MATTVSTQSSQYLASSPDVAALEEQERHDQFVVSVTVYSTQSI